MRSAEVPAPPGAALDEAALRAWGRTLGATLPLPAVIALRGPLGAGKTTLAQAILEGAGVSEPVTSPTFALVQTYASARGGIAHLDLYRLRTSDELLALGWDDILRDTALVVVEWPERVAGSLLGARLEIALDDLATDPTRRRVEVAWTA